MRTTSSSIRLINYNTIIASLHDCIREVLSAQMIEIGSPVSNDPDNDARMQGHLNNVIHALSIIRADVNTLSDEYEPENKEQALEDKARPFVEVALEALVTGDMNSEGVEFNGKRYRLSSVEFHNWPKEGFDHE